MTKIQKNNSQTSSKKDNWRFHSRKQNPNYKKGLKSISLRSCLIHDNAELKKIVKSEPKWLSTISYDEICEKTGEILNENLKHETNEIKSSNGRKILMMDKFSDFYQPLYKAKEVSLIMHTFTRANYSNLTFRRMIDNIKFHYSEQLQKEIRGYSWVAEVSEKLHWHYHFILATDRMKIKQIPEEMKFEKIWGQRTGVEFIKKDVRKYLSKYFAKHSSRIIGTRAMGKSRNFY